MGAQYKALPLPELDRFSKERQGEPETLIHLCTVELTADSQLKTEAIRINATFHFRYFVTAVISNSINQTSRAILLYKILLYRKKSFS